MDNSLCPPEIVSGGDTVKSCTKPVGSWAGKGDRALAHSNSSQHHAGDDCRALIFLLEAETQEDEAVLESSGPTKPTREDSLQTTTGTPLRDGTCLWSVGWRGVSLQENPSLLPAPALEAGGCKFVAPLPRHHKTERPTFLPAQHQLLFWWWRHRWELIAFNICTNPGQDVPSESPISPLSIANPLSKGGARVVPVA